MNIMNAVLIAGGYGVVGQQIALAIRKRHPDIPLIIAGRNPAKAREFARKLTNSDSLLLDIEKENPLNGIKPRAILAAVNDPHDYLLTEAVKNGIQYMDITRWTDRLKESLSRLSNKSLRAPVIFSSAWMAGAAAVTAASAARGLKCVDNIDISVLYSLKDKAGPNSAEYMDRLTIPFEVMISGNRKRVYPYTDPRRITFPCGYTAKAYRFDTPDQLTLPATTGAKTVSARIAFDDLMSTNFLVFLTRSGIWRLISGKRFTSLRRSLLYNPGRGASHEIVIEVSGIDINGNSKIIRTSISDPEGQTHLTAIGALVQLERLFGLDGAPPPDPGIIYPDTAPRADFYEVLKAFGVSVVVEYSMTQKASV